MTEVEFCQFLAKKIRNEMEENQVTVEQLSKESGLCFERISAIVSGDKCPTIWEAYSMAGPLKVGWAFFFLSEGQIEEEEQVRKVFSARPYGRDIYEC